jgi:hypothetical protein
MLENDQRFIERDVDDACDVESSAVDFVVVKPRPDVMNDFNLRVVDESCSSLTRLERQRKFPIHLRAFSSQLDFETGSFQEIASQHEIRASKDIDSSRLPSSTVVIPGNATEPMEAPHILGNRLGPAHLRMILEHIPAASRIYVRATAEVPDHSLDPVGRQLDVVVQERDHRREFPPGLPWLGAFEEPRKPGILPDARAGEALE